MYCAQDGITNKKLIKFDIEIIVYLSKMPVKLFLMVNSKI